MLLDDTLTGGERTVALDEAEHRVRDVLAGIGLSPELDDWGDGGEPTAWSCRLRQDGRIAPKGEGLGKGSTAQARVGALYEALEHYLTGPARFDPASVEFRTAGELAAGPLGAEASALLLRQNPDAELACHRYTGPAGELLVPLYLSAPWYVDTPAVRAAAGDRTDYTQLARYSCNSGSAIGVTLAEALVHALNETIERDAFSLLLARAFLGRPGHRLTVVDPASLPADLAAAHTRAEQLTRGPVALLDITTDLGVPTMLAYAPPTAGRPHYRGVGTSLSARYAGWRALTELVQCMLGVAREPEPPRSDLSGLAAHPALHACGRFDLTPHLATADRVPLRPSSPPADHAAHLTRLLTNTGHPPYHRVITHLPHDITAVHTQIPTLDRFNLITDGLLILPSRRTTQLAIGPL